MSKLRRIDDTRYVHFVTFSCYHRRRLLDHDQPKRIVLGVLTDELSKIDARCIGFVIMPDHVHALIWFPEVGCLSRFMQQWKGRSSKVIKAFLFGSIMEYSSKLSMTDPIWQVRFYPFEIDSVAKIEEKLNYMYMNPVRATLVEKPTEWRWSSARWYVEGRTVGVPIHWVERTDALLYWVLLLFLRHPDAQSSVWATLFTIKWPSSAQDSRRLHSPRLRGTIWRRVTEYWGGWPRRRSGRLGCKATRGLTISIRPQKSYL